MTRKARLGFIGAGWWATANHIPLLAARDDVELAAVCRLGADELRRVKDAFRLPLRHRGRRRAGAPARARRRDRHLAAHAAPRARPARPRARAARDVRQADVYARRPRPGARPPGPRKGVHLLVPYGWHYKPFVQQAKRWLDAGRIGEVQGVMCHMASPIRDLLQGKRFETEGNSGQAGGVLFEPDPRTWADPEIAGGGYGHAQLSHSTGLLCLLTGLVPEAVHAFMAAPGARVDLYDALSVRFAGGAIGTVSGAGTVPPIGRGQLPGRSAALRQRGHAAARLRTRPARTAPARRRRRQALDLAPDAGAYSCEGPPANFVELILGKTAENHSPGEAAMRLRCCCSTPPTARPPPAGSSAS